jgi:hypothetical protein
MGATLKQNLNITQEAHNQCKIEIENLQDIERAIKGASSMKCKTCLKLITTQSFINHHDLCSNVYSIPLDITVCDYVKQTNPNERSPHYAYNISITLLDTTWYISKRFKQLWLLHKKLITCFTYNQERLSEFIECTKHLLFEDKNERMNEKEKAKLASERMYFIRDYLAAIIDLDCKLPVTCTPCTVPPPFHVF